jgi:hypothetical protein
MFELLGTLIVPSIQQAGCPGNDNLAKANRAVLADMWWNIGVLSRLNGARRKTRAPVFGELGLNNGGWIPQ